MSSCKLILSVVFLCTGRAAADDQWQSSVNEEGKNVQQLKIQAPSMSEEDQYGYNMPDQYRCDSCKVVAFHVTEALKRKEPKNRRLHEWEYAELFDDTCKTGFSGYGISVVDGENVLSGPALKRSEDIKAGMGSIQMGGETWEKRLGEICRKFIYEKIGEDEVYEHFRSQGEVSSDLCFSETRDCKATKLGPEPPSQTSEGKKKIEKKAKKEKKEKGDTAVAKAKAVEDIDVSAFVSRLAKKHGLAPIQYTKKRSFAEWEQLLVQMAGKIFSSEAPVTV